MSSHNLAAIAFVARIETRHRWAALGSVAAIVAVVATGILGAFVGAHRTATAVDRSRAASSASDVSYQTEDAAQAQPLLEAFAGVAGVETVEQRILVNGFPADEAIPDLAIHTDPTGGYANDIDRPQLLAGRWPRPSAPDEVLLNEQAVRLTGLRLGARLPVRTWTSKDLEALFTGDGFPGFNGPPVELVVVGISRSPAELPDEIRRGSPTAYAPPGFLAAHPEVGPWPPVIAVRLAPGAALPDVEDRVRRRLEAEGRDDLLPVISGGTTAGEQYLNGVDQAVGTLVTGLLVFAAAAAVAGAIALSQVVSRHLAGQLNSPLTLAALGMTRRESALASTIPLVGAAAVGTAIGTIASVALSGAFPLGLARRAETASGLWAPAGLLAAGATGLLLIFASGAFLLARRHRGVEREQPRRDRGEGLVPRSLARLGASPTVATGVRFANDAGRGRRSVPVRSALVGVVLGVAGIAASGVVALSYSGLSGQPERWGWNWTTLPDEFGDVAAAETLAADDRLAAVGSIRSTTVVIDDQPVLGYAMVGRKGAISFTRRSGRLPSGPGEIALGALTLRELGKEIGDTVEATTADDTRSLVIVGTAVLPPIDVAPIDAGAVLTPEGLTAVDQGDLLETTALRYPGGTDVDRLERALNEDYGLSFPIFSRPQVPGVVRNLSETRTIAIALGTFFALLGSLGLLHVLFVSAGRRRKELAVLRVLGFQRRQVRGTILVQALALAAAGSAIGVPVGLVVGRLAWRAVTSEVGAITGPHTPWVLLLLTVPAVACGAALASWAPSRGAARRSPAADLRAE